MRHEIPARLMIEARALLVCVLTVPAMAVRLNAKALPDESVQERQW